MQLSKKDRKIAREVIEKGLQKEFAKGLYDADTILQEWKNKKTDNRSIYHLLYKTIAKFDKHIARRYDRITGSNYIYIVAAQLADGIISKEELKDFSEETRKSILLISGLENS